MEHLTHQPRLVLDWHFSTPKMSCCPHVGAQGTRHPSRRQQRPARRMARALSTDMGATTHFGSREVPVEDKARLVGEVFHGVADNYDRMNDVLSLGVHRCWKDAFVAALHPQPGAAFLDVAGGTGDIAFRLVDRLQAAARADGEPSAVMVLDINSSMLKVGEERAAERYGALPSSVDLRFVEGDAQNLPLPDESVDQYTIAFGIRNVTDIPAALREAHRVLRRGGRFSCLEFSRVEAPIVGPVYRWYNATVLPVAGHVVAGDWAAYQYLAESIERFPDQETFRAMIADAGFHAATYSNYSLGIVAAHDGWKL
eukprot:TRINITY_DN10114_c0_g1_i3.p1 TRINITY_DN10114_c0_g1~~TRINITY_DN10114_c0_g1_i3.p1  ORF type:complete len:312 (-),score=86.55 TRINITY_DN10114_c0_g1_i3:239-1174(-)